MRFRLYDLLKLPLPLASMKKLLSLLSFIFVTTILSAQQIPNGSFQYWSSPLAPDGWGTWATAIEFINSDAADSLGRLVYRDSVAGDYATDSATLRLTVDTITLPFQGLVTLAGFASLGGSEFIGPPTGTGLEYGFIPYVSRPDTLYTDYKYIPAGSNDIAVIVLFLSKWDTINLVRDTLLAQSFILPASSQWRRNVAFPLFNFYNHSSAYWDTIRPDSMQLFIYSSVANPPTRGTTLWIDSLHFDASVDPIIDTLPKDTSHVGIIDIGALRGVSVYPNPADRQLHIGIAQSEIGDGIKLYNDIGQQVYDGKLTEQFSAIDTHTLPDGAYSLCVYSCDRITRYKGTVCITH